MFNGLYTAIITPFLPNGEIDEEALRKLVEEQVSSGVSGIVPVGTTGESPTTTSEEDYRVFQIVVDQVKKRVFILAGTGSNCTKEAIEHTLYAKKAGADASLIVCPYYNKPTQKGLILHYEKIAEETKMPLIVYNIKGRTSVNMMTDTLMTLACNPYIVGVKEASGDINQAKEVIARSPKGFSVLSGEEELTYEIIRSGGHGVISVVSNIIPKEMVEFVRLALLRDSQAEVQHQYFLRLFRAMFIETNPIPVKTALSLMGKCSEVFRLPLCSMDDSNKKILEQILQEYNLS